MDSTANTLAAIRAGDRRLIARAITALENGHAQAPACALRWPNMQAARTWWVSPGRRAVASRRWSRR
jgi:putative protein kinase ArgK-like GTPase of G3E family